MNIITAYPVIMNGKVIANKIAANTLNFSSFDDNGKPTKSDEVKMFQKWLVAKGVDISYKNKKGQVVSGAAAIDGDMRSGSKTAKAWSTYGTGFVADMKALGTTLGQTFGPSQSIPDSVPATDTSKAQQDKMAKLGLFLDKAKGIYTKGKELGLFDGILNRLGLGGSTPQDQTQISTTLTGSQDAPVTGMSKTMKIVLISGGVLALIGIILVVAKSNGKGK